jgi:uncharacterized protein YkwD
MLLVSVGWTALVGCSSGAKAYHPSSGVVTLVQQDALDSTNAYRSDAQVPPLSFHAALNRSAIDHAGYQAIRGGALTHYESTDGSPGGPADTGNALYRGVGLTQRIRAANVNNQNLFQSNVYYEDISSIAGVPAIRSLWNTVYHRLPLMRHETQVFGFGDSDIARADHPGVVPGISGYATTDCAGDLGAPTTVTLSFWPRIGQWGIDTSFNTDSETPDPLSSANGGQNPATPDIDFCGVPIHIICPTTKSWASITATVHPQGGSNLALIVLCGGANVPTGASTDNELAVGEIFVLPSAPLSASTEYVVRVDAITVNTALSGPSNAETCIVGASPPWTFRTK